MPKNPVPKRSSIWIYFSPQSRDLGKCSLCGITISTRGGSTSNLRRHIKSKHSKIKLENPNNHQKKKTKVIVEDEEQGIHVEEMQSFPIEQAEGEVVVEECADERFHSEVVFHDYTAVEQVEVAVDEHGNTQPAIIVEEPCSPIRKQVQSSARNNNTGNNKTITNFRSNFLLPDKINRKTEALEQIAYNLGRLATVFEKISGLMCSLSPHYEEREERASEDVGVKVDGLIMNVLSSEQS